MSMPHWEYFLAIEQDLEKCTRYVQFDARNYGTYSLEFARIIVASGAECDTVMKLLCGSIDSSRNPNNISGYFPVVSSAYPRFAEYEINIPRYGLSFMPWKGWSSTDSPDWWKNAYNKIKHERDQHFDSANLGNAILAAAALLCTLLYYYKQLQSQVAEPERATFIDIGDAQSPRLLWPKRYDSSWQGADILWDYEIL